MNVLSIRNLTRHYGRRVGVERINLELERGVLFGFLGPNGSGKTTTIRVLLGLLKPGGGSARILGSDCWRDSPRIKAEVGYLPGDLRLYPWMTCRSALSLFGRVRGRSILAPGLELADRLLLDPDVRVRVMSRGMRQKLGLVLALSHRPRLLILDEPTTALDPLMQRELHRHLRQRVADGCTVFFSSHTLGEVERLCDRVAILRGGTLVADERLADLRARATRVVTIDFERASTMDGIQPPPVLDVHARGSYRWEARLRGPVRELIRWGAGQPIADMSIGQPDLSAVFQGFYADGEGVV